MKNHLPLILLAACLVALWPLSSCEPAPEVPEYYLDQETLDYCYFKNESWWTYEGANGQTDSVWVFESSKRLFYMKRLYGAYVDVMGLKTFSTYLNDEIRWQSEICISDTIYPSKGFGHHVYGFPEESWRVFYAYFDPSEADYVPCGQTGPRVTYLDEFNKWGGFENVRVFESHHGFANYPRMIYWAKNIGIIKKVMPDGTEWTLKRYHVIQ